MIFRLVLLVTLTTTTCTGFTPCAIRTNIATDLRMAASSFDPKPNDGWTGKSGYVKKSSKPTPSTKQVSKWERMTMQDVMIDPNYYLTYAVALLGPLIMWYHPCKYFASFTGVSDGNFSVRPCHILTSLCLSEYFS
jgi:hypothetical protein